MFCPNCGKEITDKSSSVCPYCGCPLPMQVSQDVPVGGGVDPARPIEGSGATGAITPENFRSLPTYKPNLMKMIIFGAIEFVFFALGLVGALLFRFGGSKEPEGYLALMLPGLIIGFIFFVITLSLNKKTFPNVNVKMKGIEFLIPIFIAFGLCCAVGALAVMGIALIVY